MSEITLDALKSDYHALGARIAAWAVVAICMVVMAIGTSIAAVAAFDWAMR